MPLGKIFYFLNLIPSTEITSIDRSPYHITLFQTISREFRGDPGVKALPSNTGGMGSISGWETNILHAVLSSRANRHTSKRLQIFKSFWQQAHTE